MSRPDVVLLHGGFMGGWCWREVADRLTAMGARVFTPTLTGLGERSHLLSPAVTLDTHVADIVNLVRYERLDDFVLCGHSYGGMVISCVAEQIASRIRALVYLDAYNPLPGASVWDALSDRARLGFEAATDTLGGVTPGAAGPTLVEPAHAPLVNALSTPHPRRTLEERAPLTNARARVAMKVYVRATGYPSNMLDRCAARAVDDPDWTSIELPFAHNVMIDHPATATAILADVIWPLSAGAMRPSITPAGAIA